MRQLGNDKASSKVQWLIPYFFRARLSRKIVLWVFTSIVLIEIVILLPSVYRRQQELLAYLRQVSTARVSGTMQSLGSNPSEPTLLQQLQQTTVLPIVGGSLYRSNGQLVGTFGEPPTLSLKDSSAQQSRYLAKQNRYEAIAIPTPFPAQYRLILRYDTQAVTQEVFAFVGRIAGLVLIIAVFVTVGTMIGLEAMLITPVLKLRNDLLQAGKAVQQDQEPPEFASLQFCRNDELGEVIAAFAQMYQQVSDSIAERKEAQRASARLAEIGELTAMIVHEVRNPLTTVLMGLNSFQKLELPAKAQLQLGLALEEADRLQRLLNEILLYTKCQILQLTDIELNAFITELLIPIQQMPSVQGRSVTFQPCSTDAWIKGDRDKLKQVFINLVDNACEAIDAGEVVVWAVQGKPSQQIVQIEFHNGGHPIPQDVIPHITKPFYTTKPAGNGLGLAVVKRIVEAHQGKLQVESAAVIGTTIRILLPLVPVG